MNKTAQCQEKYVTASSFIITKLPFLSSPLPIKPCIASNLSDSPKLENLIWSEQNKSDYSRLKDRDLMDWRFPIPQIIFQT